MAKPVVAFDCDDVIVATGSLFIAHYNRLHGTALSPKDFYSKDYEHVWQADEQTAIRDLFAYILTDDYARLVPMPGAIDTLRELAKTHTLYIVTGRPDSTEAATRRWVETFLPGVFKDIIFTNFFKLSDSVNPLKSKADVCLSIGAQYLVDDHLPHILGATEKGISGVLFNDFPWEQSVVLPSNTVRAKNWQELAAYFKSE